MEATMADYSPYFPYYGNTARRLVLPGGLQGRSRHVDDDDWRSSMDVEV